MTFAIKSEVSKKKYSSSFGLFKYLKPYAFIFSLGLLLLVVSGLLVIVITALLGFLMSPTGQSAIPGGAMSQQILKIFNWQGESATSQTLFVLVGLLIIQGVFSFFRVYIFAYVTENAMFQLRKDTFSKLIRMPMQFYNEKRVGDLSSRLTSDITAIQETLTTTLAEFLRQSVIIVVGVGWLVAYSPYLTLVMLGSLPVIIVILVFFGRFIKKLSKETQDKVAEAGVVINESFTSITSVKGFSNEPYESSRFTEKISFVKQFAMKSAVWRGMFGTFIIIFLFGALGLVIGVGAYLQQSGQLSADILPQFIMLTGLVAGSIGGLAAQMGSLQRSFGIIDSVMEILAMDSEELPVEASATPKLKGEIEFRDISFAYPSRPESLILNQVNLTIKPGQQIALVGSSGSGKSTIANLALRFYDITTGEILFDGESAKQKSLRDIRNNMAYVPQEVLLFGGTIYENIRYGNPLATEEEVFDAAKKANAFEFVSNFPEQFQTIVGERGIQLSGGQRQRIAIARAILKNPAILILDEATSALDSENEKLVQQALNELMQNRTSIVIAHRLSTIRQADCIYVIEEGKILEFGTHQELLSQNGAYKRMLEIQEQLN
ncbi:MAG: ATP-binding cassette domain-containing protein [Bacteroidetes bacterium]|nr:ATP-binding cassette domain-containing protein [Bacteroidota bacterium]